LEITQDRPDGGANGSGTMFVGVPVSQAEGYLNGPMNVEQLL
jgi:hypothetical protein